MHRSYLRRLKLMGVYSMSKMNEVLLKQGRITQEQHDRAEAKEQKRKAAKDKAKSGLTKLTKQELIDIIESIL